MQEEVKTEENTFHQLKGANVFSELSQVKKSAKGVINDINALSNLIASAASNGLEVKVSIEGLGEHSRARNVFACGRNNYWINLYVVVYNFAHTSLKVNGCVCYGGSETRKITTISDAINALFSLVQANKISVPNPNPNRKQLL